MIDPERWLIGHSDEEFLEAGGGPLSVGSLARPCPCARPLVLRDADDSRCLKCGRASGILGRDVVEVPEVADG